MDKLKEDIEELKTHLAKAQKQTAKLKTELEVERARVRSPSPEQVPSATDL